MYETQVTRVKLSNFISCSKFLNINQMLICLFPSVRYIYLMDPGRSVDTFV